MNQPPVLCLPGHWDGNGIGQMDSRQLTTLLHVGLLITTDADSMVSQSTRIQPNHSDSAAGIPGSETTMYIPLRNSHMLVCLPYTGRLFCIEEMHFPVNNKNRLVQQSASAAGTPGSEATVIELQASLTMMKLAMAMMPNITNTPQGSRLTSSDPR